MNASCTPSGATAMTTTTVCGVLAQSTSKEPSQKGRVDATSRLANIEPLGGGDSSSIRVLTPIREGSWYSAPCKSRAEGSAPWRAPDLCPRRGYGPQVRRQYHPGTSAAEWMTEKEAYGS